MQTELTWSVKNRLVEIFVCLHAFYGTTLENIKQRSKKFDQLSVYIGLLYVLKYS